MSDVAALEAEVKEFKIQLETVESSLQVEPDNTELQSLKTELEELITLTETAIAELKPSAPAAKPKPTPAPSKESWSSKDSIPRASQPTVDRTDEAAATAPAPAASFSVNDTVLARWVSGDNAFYPARITSVTGSSSNPVYLVSFKSYATVENLTAKDIRPIAGNDSRKRKADGTPGSSASPSPAPPSISHANVISAAADINPTLANQARQEPVKGGDASVRPAKVPRKVKANKELEEGKNKWQNFAAKGKGKFGKKESMFRTGDSLNARVGFTGSGQQMRRDPTRTRHVYQQAEDEGY
ncbi:Splicing factor spf30 [Penicillium rolfsii]|nr:Splicing factor spf30 [Penicillium rolfsii]